MIRSYLQAMQATCRMSVPPLSLLHLALIDVPRLDGVWNVLRNFSSDSLYRPEDYVGRTRFNAILRLSCTTIRRMTAIRQLARVSHCAQCDCAKLSIKETIAPRIYRYIPTRTPCVSAAEHHAGPQ
jgi:hypothetical protein